MPRDHPSRRVSLPVWFEANLRYLLLAPTVAVLAALTIVPSLYLFGASFLVADPAAVNADRSVALTNFVRLGADGQLHNAIWNTLLFTTLAVTIELALGLMAALFIDRYVRRLGVLRTILLLPMMLPPIAVAITWKLLYQPQFGVLNDLIRRMGGEGILWTSSADTALVSIILVDVWEWTPLIMLLCLAGLAALPSEPYEAAVLDGANAWQRFRDLTLPFLRPVLAIALLLRSMDALRLFDQVYVLTGGGPAGATETLSYYIYKVAFRFFDIGYAAAISLVMLGTVLLLSSLFLKRMRLIE